MRSILTAAVASIMSQVVCAETVTVETLRVAGAGSCVPYHVAYSSDTSETTIDFSVKPFEKVQVLMRNSEGFEKKVQAIPYGDLFSFNGSYSTATVQVGKCSFSLSHAPQVNQTEESKVKSTSTKAGEARLKQIQQQMDKVIAIIEKNNELPKIDAGSPESMAAMSSDQSYPIGVIEKPAVKLEPSSKIVEPRVVQNDEWRLVKPMTTVQPLKTWKFESGRNSALFELDHGYEVISAKDAKGVNQYRGKINNLHRVLLPYMSDDKITLEIRDLKSNAFVYYFESPESIKQSSVAQQVVNPNASAAQANEESVSILETEDWKLVKPDTKKQPVIDVTYEHDRNAVLLKLQTGFGFELVKATDRGGKNMYKGKINGKHRVLLPYTSDDKVVIQISDAKSNKYVYSFVPSVLTTPAVKQPVVSSAVDSNTDQQIKPIAEEVKQPEQPTFTEVDSALQATGYVVELNKGRYLSNELSAFANKTFGWTLVWNRNKDMVVNVNTSFNVKDINDFTAWMIDNLKASVKLDVNNKQILVAE